MRDLYDDDLNPDDKARSPDSLSPLPPAPEVKVRQVKAPRPLSRHPVVKYGGIGGLLAFLGGLIAYLFNWFFSDWTRP
jgi:hypothetical protein